MKNQNNKKKRYTYMKIQGTGAWVKILKPVANYAKTGEEWTMDLGLEDDAIKELTDAGLAHKIKPAVNPETGKEHATNLPYIKFSVPTKTVKGDAIRAPKVVDKYGKAWDPNDMIGNGSTLNVIFNIREGSDYGGWRKPDLKSVQVWDYVPVEPADEFDYVEGEPIEEEEAWDESEG